MKEMSFSQLCKLLFALVVVGLACYLGWIILPVLRGWAPVLAWTVGIAAEMVLVSVAICAILAPFGLFLHLQSKNRIALMQAGKLEVTPQGYIQGYIATRADERMLVPHITAHSPFVPSTVHIEEDNSNSASAANDLRERQFAWKQYMDMQRLNPGTPEEAFPLPNKVFYEQIKHLIPEGHALLGALSDNQVDTCDFEELMTMWICGGSSSGKSNSVSIKVNEAIEHGHNTKIILIDPHKVKPDSLYNKIKCYESRFLFPVASRKDEIIKALSWFEEEFERRLYAYDEQHDDIILIVDEVPALMETHLEKRDRTEIPGKLKNIAAICGQQSRGFGMFGWFVSQNAVGLAWLRNLALTVIAHKMLMMNERLLACNDDKTIAENMGKWPTGRVCVYGMNFQEVKVLQMPIFKPPTVVEGSVSVYEGMEELQPKQTHTLPEIMADNVRIFPLRKEQDDVQPKRDDGIVVWNNLIKKNEEEPSRRLFWSALKEAGFPKCRENVARDLWESIRKEARQQAYSG